MIACNLRQDRCAHIRQPNACMFMLFSFNSFLFSLMCLVCICTYACMHRHSYIEISDNQLKNASIHTSQTHNMLWCIQKCTEFRSIIYATHKKSFNRTCRCRCVRVRFSCASQMQIKWIAIERIIAITNVQLYMCVCSH